MLIKKLLHFPAFFGLFVDLIFHFLEGFKKVLLLSANGTVLGIHCFIYVLIKMGHISAEVALFANELPVECFLLLGFEKST